MENRPLPSTQASIVFAFILFMGAGVFLSAQWTNSTNAALWAETERKNAEGWERVARENAEGWARVTRENEERWAQTNRENAARWKLTQRDNAERFYRAMRANLDSAKDNYTLEECERRLKKIDATWRQTNAGPLPAFP